MRPKKLAAAASILPDEPQDSSKLAAAACDPGNNALEFKAELSPLSSPEGIIVCKAAPFRGREENRVFMGDGPDVPQANAIRKSDMWSGEIVCTVLCRKQL